MSDEARDEAIVGRYRLREKLGRGGMGEVYVAEHVETGKRAAIKVLHEHFSERPEALERFRREAQAASLIEHENIVSVIDFWHEPGGRAYLVMELLRGENLKGTLRQYGRLEWRIARSIVLQLCDALQAVHEVGIVHRDLKLENIFRTQIGDNPFFVKILDFGIAKLRTDAFDGEPTLTAAGTVLGTLTYMAPEQADDSARVDHRADIYSLGVILYHLVAGRLPIRGQSEAQMLYNLVHREPLPLREAAPEVEFPPDLEAVIMRALVKRPEDRYDDMRAFASALRGVEDGPVSARTAPSAGASGTSVEPPLLESSQRTRVDPPGGRRWRVSVAAALALALLVSAGVLGARLLGEQRQEAPPGAAAAAAAIVDAQPPAPIELEETPASAPEGSEGEEERAANTTREVAEPPSEPPSEPPPATQPSKRVRAGGSAAAAESTPKARQQRAKQGARALIKASLVRHAARATTEKVQIRVTFNPLTRKVSEFRLGGNLEDTNFGRGVKKDLLKAELPPFDESFVIDEEFAIPQE